MILKKIIAAAAAAAIAATAFGAMSITASAEGVTEYTWDFTGRTDNQNVTLSAGTTYYVSPGKAITDATFLTSQPESGEYITIINTGNVNATVDKTSLSYGNTKATTIRYTPSQSGWVSISAKNKFGMKVNDNEMDKYRIIDPTASAGNAEYKVQVTANTEYTFTASDKYQRIYNVKFLENEPIGTTEAHYTISEVKGGKFYYYHEADGTIKESQNTSEGDTVCIKENSFTVYPNDDTVTGVSVTYNGTEEYVNKTVSLTGLNLTGTGGITFYIWAPSLTGNNAEVGSAKFTPSVTVQ